MNGARAEITSAVENFIIGIFRHGEEAPGDAMIVQSDWPIFHVGTQIARRRVAVSRKHIDGQFRSSVSSSEALAPAKLGAACLYGERPCRNCNDGALAIDVRGPSRIGCSCRLRNTDCSRNCQANKVFSQDACHFNYHVHPFSRRASARGVSRNGSGPIPIEDRAGLC
jgi:hypothetical protein